MDNKVDKISRSIRALEVVEVVVNADRTMTVADIMTATGLPKATVHRLCGVLEQGGFLAPDIGGKGLTIGHRTRDLALGIMALGGVDAYRHRILTELSREIGETCNLNVPAGSEILYVDRVESEWPLRTQLPVGSRVPLHCTASGKLYLSSLPAARRRKLIAAMTLDRQTANTIVDPEALNAELDKTRRAKVGTDNEEFIDGMVAAAVPITDQRGRLAAILAFHAPVIRMDMEKALVHVPALQRAAAALSADINE